MADTCQHRHTARGILHFDFARLSEPEHPQYSAPVRVSVCEECGYIQLHAESQRQLCNWLRGDWTTVPKK